MEILNFGLQGIIAYGVVGLVSLLLKKKDIELDPDIKLYLLVGIAFLVGFIPADLGNVIFNHIKEAVGIAFAISTFNTVANKVGR